MPKEFTELIDSAPDKESTPFKIQWKRPHQVERNYHFNRSKGHWAKQETCSLFFKPVTVLQGKTQCSRITTGFTDFCLVISLNPPTDSQHYPEVKKEVSWVCHLCCPASPSGTTNAAGPQFGGQDRTSRAKPASAALYQILSKSASGPNVFLHAKYEQHS